MKFLLKFIASMGMILSLSAMAEVSVIVNNANSDTIDAQTLKRIYLGKMKTFPNGNKVTLLTLKDSDPSTEPFRKKALRKSNSQFKSYWSKLAFTGKGMPPKEMDNAAEMIKAVKADTAAMGFVDSAMVSGDVKVIATF
jgi:ABC-type phosphate transport system substrate-binding protein